jgi:glutamate synthase (NADPH) small chain
VPDPTGFLKYERQLPKARPVPVRLLDWREVYPPAEEELVREQATRCMGCGIPYCHHACPLGNIIPDWNDMVRVGDWQSASDRLHATNNFPEVTGRVCPAPCEGACVLNIRDTPVTIKQVEVEIANRRLSLSPLHTSIRTGRSVGVVGSGPAGLAAAQQLARAGHDVVLYERSDRIGGLMRYGIPDFKLEKHHLDRRVEQMAAEGVRFVTNCAVGVDVTVDQLREQHDALLLACGALNARDVADTPGREISGIYQAMEYLTGSNRVVNGDLDAPPITAAGKNVIVLGGGDTAADCLGTAHRQGAASVHLIEVVPEPRRTRDILANPWPTWPQILRTGSAHEEGGVRLFGASVQRFLADDAGRLSGVLVADVTLASDGSFRLTPVPGSEREYPAELVLLAIGFAGAEAGPLLDQAKLARNKRGTVQTDDAWQTDTPGVFACGDMRRGPSLIVWAIAEGRSAAAAVHRYLGCDGNLPDPITPASRPLSV